MTPTNLEEQLVRDEGEILYAYQDSNGFWTIGVGTLIDRHAGGGITREESRYLLSNRIQTAENAVNVCLPWAAGLDRIRFGALVNMAFNMGIEHLKGFEKFLTALEMRDYQRASAEMLDSQWAREVGERAQRLSQQILTGEWT